MYAVGHDAGGYDAGYDDASQDDGRAAGYAHGYEDHGAPPPPPRVARAPFVYNAGSRVLGVRNWRPDWAALIAFVAGELEERRRWRSDEHRLVVAARGISPAGGVQPSLAGAVPVHAWTNVGDVVEARIRE